LVELIDPMAPLRFHQASRQMIVMPIRADVGNSSAQASKPEPAAIPPEERRTTMPTNTGHGSQHTAPKEEKPTLEKALGDIENI
jgi:hypothetical protein